MLFTWTSPDKAIRIRNATALQRDCSKLMLLSGAGRAGAHGFFTRHGFDGSAKQGFVKYRRAFAAA